MTTEALDSPDPIDSQELATAQEPQPPRDPKDLDRYECRSCGYSYEPIKGDSTNNIPAGVAFEQLPEAWRCPV